MNFCFLFRSCCPWHDNSIYGPISMGLIKWLCRIGVQPHAKPMLNRILSPAIAPKLQLRDRIWQYSKSAGRSRSHNTSPTLNKPTDGKVVENVELTFVEEPLGLRADQGYGYLQVDFGQRIGSGNRYEILRKLGWGGNVSKASASTKFSPVS